MDLHAEIPYSLALLDQYVGKASSEWQANKNENLPFSRASILLIQHQVRSLSNKVIFRHQKLML
jgi:hypothetical protein